MITLSTEDKTIDTGPAARLITEGEKNADVIRIEMPASYGTLDLTALTWVLAGVTDRETRVEQELAKDTSDGLTLQWTVTGDWAAVPGRMRLELSGISADGAAVIKFTGRPIEVRPAAEIYGLPRPELSEQYLETMRELVEQAREAADALANAGLKILGYYDSLTALAEAVTNPQIGDLYGVGPSSEMYAYVWDGEKWAKGQALSAAGAVSSVFGRTGEVTAQAGDYTAEQVGARPDSWMPTAAQVGAVDGATGQGSAVRISNRNLLDNAYWAAQEAIINQRGATSYTTAGYGIDRWILSVGNNISLTINDGYVRLEKIVATGYPMMVQYIDPTIYNALVGKNVTLSALTTEGLFFNTFTIPEGSYDLALFNLGSTEFYCNFQRGASLPAFRIISKGSAVVGSFVNLIAAKMELGSVSTLAHQDADGNWVLNDPPPNYAEELAKCQRYFEVETLGAYTRLANMIAYDATTAYGMIPTAGKRVTPIISYPSGAVTNLSLSQGTSYLALTNLEVITCGANFLYVKATVASGLTANANYFIRTVSEPVTLGFDANL